jgi:hypothetical protein
MRGRRAVRQDSVRISRSGKSRSGSEGQAVGWNHQEPPPVALPSETPDHPLNNIRDVSLLLGHSINQVRRGQLAPRVATAIGYLAGILLSALQQGPLEERLQRLEATLGLGKGQTDMVPNVEPNNRKQN